ncbi:ATP-binding protein [Gilliamella mensalis]|uniref:ATP-binding protein n=1 Tax=Gilliamella mensalis TaxID=1908520 RepID=UPI000A149E8F|nr:ATP-binding protein [Gilliamella mensalis]
MIFTRLKIDNLFSFKNAELELSFKRKPTFPTIDGEHILGRENYYFKKVCILSGTNSSGKTSVGKILCDIQNYILQNHPLQSGDKIYNKSKFGVIEVDYATTTPKPYAHRLKIEITENNVINNILYVNSPIGKNDSCFQLRKKIDKIILNKEAPRGACFFKRDGSEVINFPFEFIKKHGVNGCWYYLFSENDETSIPIRDTFDLKIMKSILSSFDYTIEKVVEIAINGSGKKKEKKEVTGHRIYFKNGDAVDINDKGDITNNKNRLSKGTYDAIKIASLIGKIGQEKEFCDNDVTCATYYLDEKMSYSHSELEVSIINLIISKMGRNCQFFYTTHNYEVLDLNLPIHSFTFLVKDSGNSFFIEAQEKYKKNDRNLINHIKNNFFKTLPSTNELERLIED